MGSRQVTDAYLLLLARRNRAIFVTFDRKLESLADSETRIRVLS
jgi:predicted nucleic acid-binding protein